MLTAQGAYMETKKAIEGKDKEILEDIEKEMRKVIVNGGFEMYYKKVIAETVVQDLKNRGFKVKAVWAEMDDFGNVYPEYLRIAWKGKSGKRNIFHRLKKLFKREVYRCL